MLIYFLNEKPMFPSPGGKLVEPTSRPQKELLAFISNKIK